MKTEKYFVFLTAVVGILCVFAFGDVEKESQFKQVGLISQPNPALAGMEKLCVIIEPSGADPNRDGLVWKNLQAKVENVLQQAGIGITAGNPSEPELKNHTMPELWIFVDMLKFYESPKYVFRIQTSLRAEALLETQRLFLKAEVWRTAPVMQAVSVPDMPGRITNVVLEQVEAFTYACLAAGPRGAQPPSDRTGSPVSPLTPDRQTASETKLQATEYKYVASKNSEVFHNTNCSIVNRITPGNIIGYNTRDEAINAGKRPCKRCKP